MSVAYPLYSGLFEDSDAARRYLDDRGPPDPVLPECGYEHYRANTAQYAECVYDSLVDLNDTREDNSNSFKNFASGKISQAELEATAMLLVDAWIKRHELGPMQRFTKIARSDQDLDFKHRFRVMCESLRKDKLICEDVMKHGKLEEFVHRPAQSLKIKSQNKVINRERQRVLRAGNDYLHRQPKRVGRRINPPGAGQNPVMPSLPTRRATFNDASSSIDSPLRHEDVTLPPLTFGGYCVDVGRPCGIPSENGVYQVSRPGPLPFTSSTPQSNCLINPGPGNLATPTSLNTRLAPVKTEAYFGLNAEASASPLSSELTSPLGVTDGEFFTGDAHFATSFDSSDVTYTLDMGAEKLLHHQPAMLGEDD